MYVQGQDGNDYTLNLGTCSRLQNANNRDLPQAGNSIYWRGQNLSNNSINVQSALCI